MSVGAMPTRLAGCTVPVLDAVSCEGELRIRRVHEVAAVEGCHRNDTGDCEKTERPKRRLKRDLI